MGYLLNLIACPVTLALIVGNVVVFLLIQSGKVDYSKLASNYYHTFRRKQYYRLITASFTHQQWWHLLANMASLYSLGTEIESMCGSIKMLILYILATVIGKGLSLYYHHKKNDDYTFTLGASVGICGLVGFEFLLVLRIFGLTAIRYYLTSIFSFVIMQFMPNINVSGHIFGLIIGALFAFIF